MSAIRHLISLQASPPEILQGLPFPRRAYSREVDKYPVIHWCKHLAYFSYFLRPSFCQLHYGCIERDLDIPSGPAKQFTYLSATQMCDKRLISRWGCINMWSGACMCGEAAQSVNAGPPFTRIMERKEDVEKGLGLVCVAIAPRMLEGGRERAQSLVLMTLRVVGDKSSLERLKGEIYQPCLTARRAASPIFLWRELRPKYRLLLKGYRFSIPFFRSWVALWVSTLRQAGGYAWLLLWTNRQLFHMVLLQ